MKGFAIFSLIILASVCLQGDGKEICAAHNCLKPEACVRVINEAICSNGLSCCYDVRTEYRTKCRQWGGECMSSCNKDLQIARAKANDCPSNKICCVLV